ncbi:hypothetical protein KKC44_04785 [Patescibacteria group bacterium]|nr:hypothetical protein [Patescibacteria group bacterium]MBU2259891.1 hypothetical protein [Patescibacteria group bacterium]
MTFHDRMLQADCKNAIPVASIETGDDIGCRVIIYNDHGVAVNCSIRGPQQRFSDQIFSVLVMSGYREETHIIREKGIA